MFVAYRRASQLIKTFGQKARVSTFGKRQVRAVDWERLFWWRQLSRRQEAVLPLACPRQPATKDSSRRSPTDRCSADEEMHPWASAPPLFRMRFQLKVA